MTRKNKICDVIKEQFIYVKDENLKSALRFAFIDGVEWADENPNLERLWHDASEEPQGTYIILCDALDNRQWIVERFYIDMAYATWKDFAETISVRRWAYISDLLPK